MSQNISGLNQQQRYYLNQNAPQSSAPNFSANGKPITSGATVVDNNPILSAATSTPEKPGQFLASMGVSTIGLMTINDLINKSLQTKPYSATVFQKIETAVNRFFAQPKPKAVYDFFANMKHSASKWLNKSEIFRTLIHKPGVAGPMAQSQATGTIGHIASKALEAMKEYKKANPSFTEFDAILQKAGNEAFKYKDEIIRTISRSSADLTQVMTSRPWWGLGLIKNKTSLQEILNKNTLINNYKLAGKTAGQKVSGYLMRGTEALTNGLFSGKGAVLIQALMIAQSMSEASKAEKGEKFSTFMASFSELMAFMATIGLQMRATNSLVGLKNIGMTQPQYKAMLKFKEIANAASKAGDLRTYRKALLKIENLKSAVNANIKWYQKPLKWVGEIIGFGRVKDMVKPLHSSKLGTTLARIPHGLKAAAGLGIRVAFIMGVVVPIISSVAKKISHTIFGKPVKTIAREKAKEEEEKRKQEEEYQKQLQAAQQQFQQQNIPQQPVQQPMQQAPAGNLIDTMNRMKNQPTASQPIAAGEISGTTQQPQSPEANIKRTYIPNPVLGEEIIQSATPVRNAQIDKVLRQADYAEAIAQKFL